MRISLPQWIGIAIPVLFLVAYFGNINEFKKHTDSGSYIKFAEMMISGEIFVKQDLPDILYFRAVRTPGYPTIILLATGGLKGDISNLLTAHLVLAVLSLVLASIALAPYCPTLISGSILAAALLQTSKFFSLMMTEWVGMNLTIMMFAAIVICIRNPSVRNLFFVGLLASLGVLIRPALAPLMLVLPCLILYRWRLNLKEAVLFASTTLPLLLWLTFNWIYIEDFTVAQLRGQNLLGIGSLVGHTEAKPSDSAEFKEFVAAFNAKKSPAVGAEDEYVNNLDTNFHKLAFESNIYWIAYTLRKPEWGIIPFDREFMGVYGRRAIEQNFGNYLKYVTHSLKVYFGYGVPYIAIFILVIPLYGIFRRKSVVVSWAAIAMFGIHSVQGLLVAFFQAVGDRYIVLTFYPYVGAVLVCLFSLAYTTGLPQKLTALLPTPIRSIFEPQAPTT